MMQIIAISVCIKNIDYALGWVRYVSLTTKAIVMDFRHWGADIRWRYPQALWCFLGVDSLKIYQTWLRITKRRYWIFVVKCSVMDRFKSFPKNTTDILWVCLCWTHCSDAIWRLRYWSILISVMDCCLMSSSHYLNRYRLVLYLIFMCYLDAYRNQHITL